MVDLLERTLSLVVARFWPVLLEFSDSCQLTTGWIYLWMLWIVAAELDCISAQLCCCASITVFSFLVLRNALSFRIIHRITVSD